MQNYTVETFLSHHRDGSTRLWLYSFALANLALAALVLLILPLLNAKAPRFVAQETSIEWLAEDPTATQAASPAHKPDAAPVASPPPQPQPPELEPSLPPPEPEAEPEHAPPPPAIEEPKAPPKTIESDIQPLAFNHHDTPDETAPEDAPFAGLTDAQAQSRQPSTDQHDPLPVQPDGVAGSVLAMGTVGDHADAPAGVTVQESTNPGAPAASPESSTAAKTTQPNPAVTPTPDQPTATAASTGTETPAAGAASGAPPPQAPPTPIAPAAATDLAPAATAAATAGRQPGIGPGELPPTAGEVDTPVQATPTTATEPLAATPPVPPPVPPAAFPGANGKVENGTGTHTESTAPSGEGTGELAAELARLKQLQAADQATPGQTGQRSTVQIELPPTQGDSAAVSKTPLWNIRLNADKQGPDTIATYADPIARYLKDFRRILEQNFYREAGLPRSYRFRDGEYADFAMTFHKDGSIDAVALVPKSATEQFTTEMETICKTAIARSSPYNAFTEELKKEREEFTLIVRFQF